MPGIEEMIMTQFFLLGDIHAVDSIVRSRENVVALHGFREVTAEIRRQGFGVGQCAHVFGFLPVRHENLLRLRLPRR